MEYLRNDMEFVRKELDIVKQEIQKSARLASEATWAAVFNNTLTDSVWCKDKRFSPGRGAVGYPFLYVMYRVLNEIKPKKILELGLGQSTRMISQYAAHFPGIEHHVVEHDPSWLSFFENSVPLSSFTTLNLLELEFFPFKTALEVRGYKNFRNCIGDKKFDFIVIDGPFGYDMPEYSRVDVLRCLQHCISNEFVIMLDDYDRQGEKNTAAEMKSVLGQMGINYSFGVYSGLKDVLVLTSESLKFTCTM